MRTLSGIQPTGVPHLGNYLGALQHWAAPASHLALFSMMDLHALTTVRDARALRADVRTGIAVLLASGVTPSPNRILFVQSRVPQHAELAWVLSCVAPLNASAKSPTLGLLGYPVLMAADILLYNATHVPVGHDQVQHLELARDMSRAFTAAWGLPLSTPQAVVHPATARIMSLTSPMKKMSKSDPDAHSRILVSDSPDAVAAKVRRAVTDSLGPVTTRNLNQRPGVANLLGILAACTPGGFAPAQADGWDAKQLKQAVTDAVVSTIAPVGREMERLLKDEAYVDGVVAEGSQRAAELAEANMKRIRRAVGIS